MLWRRFPEVMLSQMRVATVLQERGEHSAGVLIQHQLGMNSMRLLDSLYYGKAVKYIVNSFDYG